MASQSAVKIEPLNKENFDTWKMHAEALLVKNETWEYVCGKIKRPVEKGSDAKSIADATAWDKEDRKAKSDLILAISPCVLKEVKGCVTSNDVWAKLHKIYQSKGPARKATLLKKLILNKMSENDDIRTHLADFFDAVDKLNDMQLEINEDLLSILLLYSLPNSYENFRVAVETRDELPKPDILKVKMIEEYEARKGKEVDNGAFMVRNKYKKYGNAGRQSTTEKFKENEGNSYLSTKIKCFRCRRIGHKASDCGRKWKKAYKTNEATEQSYHCMSQEKALSTCNRETFNNKIWCLDSGATAHMCSNKEKFAELTQTERTLLLASKDTAKIEGSGVVKFKPKNGCKARLENTLFVPDLRTNLISVSKITERGYSVVFENQKASIINEIGEVTAVAEKRDGLYYISENIDESSLCSKENSLRDWHEKMGHLNVYTLSDMVKYQRVHGLNMQYVNKLQEFQCETCISAKQHRKPFPKINSTRCNKLLELIHSDICGPIRTRSNGGYSYFITFIDDYSRWTQVYFLKNKSDALNMFKQFKIEVENFTERKIKTIRTDNGREYCNSEFDTYLKECGIRHQLTAEYTPQQNGVAERKNRTLIEMSRCMLLQSALPASFWAEAVATANYIRNRSSSSSIGGDVPYNLWTGKVPTVSYFRIFGSVAYVLDKTQKRSKLHTKSFKCVFVGYCTDSKAYRLWNPKTRKIIKSRDVIFVDRFPGELENDTPESSQNNESEIIFDFADTNCSTKQLEREELPIIHNPDHHPETNQELTDVGNIQTTITNTQEKRAGGRPRLLRTGRKGRPKKQYRTESTKDEEEEQEYRNAEEGEESDNTAEKESGDEMMAAIPGGGEKPHSEESCPEEFYDATYISMSDPKNVNEVLKDEHVREWKNAMKDELNAHKNNETWILVSRPKNDKVIGCRWVFQTKMDQNGGVTRRKARLVAKGCSQRSGIDFKETFAPVARQCSIRLMVAIAAEWNLTLYQLDITTAYLNGDINEVIYMELPEMYHELTGKNTKGDEVCLIKKAIYGLKQSGRQWYFKLSEELFDMGFQQLKTDPCIYLYTSEEYILMVAVHVDDIIIASNSERYIKGFVDKLNKKFKVKDAGKLTYFLGIEFNQQVNGKISMTQSKYISDILKKFNMEDCNPVSTPMDVNVKLSKKMCANTTQEKSDMENVPYQNLIGSLLYLAVTSRPDILYSVNFLSQFNKDYGKAHWIAAKRILRYLNGTRNYGLVFSRTHKDIIGFTDADWGANEDDRRSVTGYVFALGGSAVSWESRKQRTVALSSTEAEYMAIADSAKEAIYLQNLLDEAKFREKSSVIICNDNRSAQQIARNPVHHSRTKHIDIRHHFVREAMQSGKIDLAFVSTDEMTADIMTKSLPTIKHWANLERLGLRNCKLKGKC